MSVGASLLYSRGVIGRGVNISLLGGHHRDKRLQRYRVLQRVDDDHHHDKRQRLETAHAEKRPPHLVVEVEHHVQRIKHAAEQIPAKRAGADTRHDSIRPRFGKPPAQAALSGILCAEYNHRVRTIRGNGTRFRRYVALSLFDVFSDWDF